jgi:serine/threonine-protein kinase
MSLSGPLEDLIVEWEQHWERGQDLTPEQLTADPGLRDALRPLIAQRKRVHGLLQPPPAPGDSPPLPPRRVGKFEIQKLLGRGGMGVVYQAWQTDLKRPVALKLVLAGADATAEQRARFRAEAEAVARLRHPGIVQLYEIGEEDGQPYLVLELVEGVSLAAAVCGRPQDPRAAAALVEGLARAIQAAHEQHVVHRDLKPANVLLAVSSQRSAVSPPAETPAEELTADRWLLTATPKITDFGLAKLLDLPGQTPDNLPLGTAAYMAPEQAQGRGDLLGPTVDVYGLGAILYELLTGRPPFAGLTFAEALQRVCNAEPAPPRTLCPGTPADLDTICLKCLHKDPRHRYATAAALADDLHCFQERRPVLARPVGRIEKAWRWCRRNPVVASLAVLVVLGVLGLLVTTVWLVHALGYVRAEQGRTAEALGEVARQKQQRGTVVLAVKRTLDEALQELTEQDLSLQMFGAAGQVCTLADVPLNQNDVKIRLLKVFSRLESDEPEMLVVKAQACTSLGVVQWARGEWQAARQEYERALPLWRRLLNLTPRSREFRLQLSRVQNNLGGLLNEQRTPREALHHLEAAIRLREELVGEEPANPIFTRALAISYFNAGNSSLLLQKYDRATRLFERAKQPLKRVLRRRPAASEDCYALAVMDLNQGVAWSLAGKPQNAVTPMTSARSTFADLTRAFPQTARYPQGLAFAHNHLGTFLLSQGKWKEAEKEYLGAERAFEALSRILRPLPPVLEAERLGVQVNRGLLEARRGRHPQALRRYDQVLPLLLALYQKHRTVAIVQRYLRNASLNKAETLEALKRFEESAAWLAQGIPLSPAAERPRLRAFRALNLARAGRVAEAVSEAAALERLASLDGGSRYNLACTWAQASVHPTDPALRERYAAEAVAQLKRCQAARIFPAEVSVKLLHEDTDLNPLRSRPDFQQFLRGLDGRPRR